MKKFGKLLAILVLATITVSALFAFTACKLGSTNTSEYNIVFLDKDSAELSSVKVKKGEIPEFKGTYPVLPEETAEFVYAWKWDREIVAATKDTTYTLVLDAQKKSYTVTFKNGEDELQSGKVEYGTVPEYKGETPVKAGDAQYSYAFKGWDKEIVAVTGDVVYTAQFDQVVNKYTVTFKNGEVVLQSGKVEYGTVPAYDGETPEKPADAQYTYTFSGWDKEIVAVTGDVVYTAQFDKTVNEYDVTFKNGDEVLKTIKLAYGSEITVPEDVKVDGYEIIGWEPEFETVTANAEYVAILARVLTQADKDNFSAIISANPDDNYVLGSDIDFGNGSIAPIASFAGVLDGRGYKLKNVKLALNPDHDYTYTAITENFGTIKNIGLYYSVPDAQGNNRASFIHSNSGVIENVYVKITVAAAPWATASVAGENTETGVIHHVVAVWSGTNDSTAHLGSIVGADLTSTIYNAYAICNGIITSANENFNHPYKDNYPENPGDITDCANYDDMAAFLAAVDFTAEGWSECWSVKDGSIVFGEEEVVEQARILTQDDMANFANILSQNPNGKFALGSDIDFGGADLNGIAAFGGELDGKGFSLKNFKLALNANTTVVWSYAFIAANNGTIKNIGIDYVLKGNNGYEAFVNENAGMIENVFVTVKMESKGWANAALVGINQASGVVRNVVAVLTKEASVSVGGLGAIVGAERNGTVRYCYAACGDVIPASEAAFATPYFETFDNGAYIGNANYETLAELAVGATFNEADGWNQEYFAKTFKDIVDLKNA